MAWQLYKRFVQINPIRMQIIIFSISEDPVLIQSVYENGGDFRGSRQGVLISNASPLGDTLFVTNYYL